MFHNEFNYSLCQTEIFPPTLAKFSEEEFTGIILGSHSIWKNRLRKRADVKTDGAMGTLFAVDHRDTLSLTFLHLLGFQCSEKQHLAGQTCTMFPTHLQGDRQREVGPWP